MRKVGADELTAGVSLDQISIQEDANGDIAVFRPWVEVIGDFESGMGNWTLQNDANRITTDGAESTGACVETNENGNIQAGCNRTFDLTDVETIEVWLKHASGTLSEAGVEFDNNSLQTWSNISSSWEKKTVDVSGQSGSGTLEVYGDEGNNGTILNLRIDRIKAIYPKRETVESGAGN